MAVTVLSPRGGNQPVFPLTSDQLDQMQRLWEGAPELTATDIAEMFEVTKNVVIGHRWRKGWKPRKGTEPTTIFARLDALDVFPPPGRCVYPIGHPGKEGFRFCGQMVPEVGMPYCPHHHAICLITEASKRQIAAWEDDEERRLRAAERLKKLGGNKRQRMVAA